MKAIWMIPCLVVALAGEGALASERAPCGQLAGRYVLSRCSGAEKLELPGPNRHWTGELDDFIRKLDVGRMLTITQTQCHDLAFAYDDTQVELSLGDHHLAGPTGDETNRHAINQNVDWRGESLALTTRDRYIYIPIISVWYSTAKWSISKSNDGGLVIALDKKGTSGTTNETCHLRAE